MLLTERICLSQNGQPLTEKPGTSQRGQVFHRKANLLTKKSKALHKRQAYYREALLSQKGRAFH